MLKKGASGFAQLVCALATSAMVAGPAMATVSERPEAFVLSGEGPLTPSSMLQVIVGLAAVLAVILLVAWLVRRSGRFSLLGSGALRTLGVMSVGARERVVLLQVGEQQILIGVAPGRVQTLHTLDKPIVVNASPQKSNSAFSEALGAALNKKKSPQ